MTVDFRDPLLPRPTYASLGEITQIKQGAISEFERLDTRVHVHSTDYFNHSFAPDLVLRWDSGSDNERLVFLRATSRAADLVEDIGRIGNQSPIVYGLTPLEGDDNQVDAKSALDFDSRATDTLVTDATALQTLLSARDELPLSGLLSSAITRGGRGLIDDVTAADVVQVVAAGFDGAKTLGADSVGEAADALDHHLQRPFSTRFTRFLQAVWVGSGGRSDLFPRRVDATGAIDDTALEFLLELELIDDEDFWHRLGRQVSVTQLGRLSVTQPSENLQLLVKTNLDHLWCRVCQVYDAQTAIDEQDAGQHLWRIQAGHLSLRGSTWLAAVAEKSEQLEPGAQVGPGVAVSDLPKRAEGTSLTSLQMSDGRSELDLTSLVQEDVADIDHLTALEALLGATARVRKARATLSRGGQITCDFQKSRATALTNSQLLLGAFLEVAIPLLRSTDETELTALREMLSSPDDSESLTLFNAGDE